MAKVLLWELLNNLHICHPQAAPAQFIDDLGQGFADPDEDVVFRTLMRCAAPLAAGLRRLRLVVAPKATVIASSARLGERLVDRLRELGIPFHLARTGRDLGVEAVGGRRRAGGLVAQRILKAEPRARRGGGFAFRDGRAAKLFLTGALPAATWGHQAHGLAPSSVAKVVRLAAVGTGQAGSGRCSTTLMALAYGVSKHPEVRLGLELFDVWFFLWRAFPARRIVWARAWSAVAGSCARPAGGGSGCTGTSAPL